MPGKYCRGCGKHKDAMQVSDPRKCPSCGPLVVAKRLHCEHCGTPLDFKGQDPCQFCRKLAYRFFGR